jgi:signal transduction histidine kinase
LSVVTRRRRNRFLPSSLRARLTLSYATFTAALLIVLFCGLVALGLQRYIRTTMLSIDEVAASTRSVIFDHWDESDAQLTLRVQQEPREAGVRVVILPQRPFGNLPPPGGGARRQFRPGIPGQPRGPRPFGPPPERLNLSAMFGLHTRFIWMHQGEVIIAPAVRIENLLEIAATALGISLLITVLLAWGIGHWITRQAIVPLTAVTRELRRFAAGDFVPSTLQTRDASELGDLVDAYNGAAAQVVAAFSERERTEQHLRLILGEAGHEMRSPLTVISAYLEMLDKDGAGGTISPETLHTLRTETRRLRSLVERVMSLARMEGSDRSRAELVDVTEVAEEAIAHVTTAQGGDVRLTSSASDVVVLAEPWALEEAIGNLVDNAVRYGAGSPVNVSIAVQNGDVVVRVSDDGPGVSEADRAQLFRHFFRGEQAGGKAGSGLGLAIVARAASRLGGHVALESATVHRTTFSLTIPTYQPKPSGAERRVD